MTAICKKLADGLTFKKILLILLGAMICTFGIHNIHQRTNITEGGVIGLMLLVEHWLKISPAYITPMLDAACYLLAFKFLGGNFIKISINFNTDLFLYFIRSGAASANAPRFVRTSVDRRCVRR